MKVRITGNAEAEQNIPPARADGSRIGVNYADAFIEPMNITLEDGRRVTCRRRGLKITLTVGELKGEGLLRRIQNGPDVKNILHRALQEAAQAIGAGVLVEEGSICLELPE